MKLAVASLLFMLTLCRAVPEFAIDPACIDYRDGIISGVREAIELAETAFLILDQHRQDEHVQTICRALLDNGQNFDHKLDQAKAVFQGISQFSRDPSPLSPFDEQWINRASNRDVSLWCSADWFSRVDNGIYHRIRDKKVLLQNEATRQLEKECLNSAYDPGEDDAIMASTLSSDIFNIVTYNRELRNDQTVRKSDPRFRREIPFPNDIALCHWFLAKTSVVTGWARIDHARVSRATTPEFRETLIASKRLIDGMKTFGSTMLHELSHTNQGLLRTDVEPRFRNGATSCYNWACATQFHDEHNADTISLLAIALKVWQLGFKVDMDGNISPR